MSRSWTRYSIVPNNEPGFFSQFLGSLQPGMSVQEVENAVDDYVASIDEENLLSSINRQEMTMKELLGANNYEMFRERLTRAGLSDYLNKLDLEDRSSGSLYERMTRVIEHYKRPEAMEQVSNLNPADKETWEKFMSDLLTADEPHVLEEALRRVEEFYPTEFWNGEQSEYDEVEGTTPGALQYVEGSSTGDSVHVENVDREDAVQPSSPAIAAWMAQREHIHRLAQDPNPTEPPSREQPGEPFPDLMTPDPLMDSRDVLDFPPTRDNPYSNRVVVRNHSSMFLEALREDDFDFSDRNWKPQRTDDPEETSTVFDHLPLSQKDVDRKYYVIPALFRMAKQQTGKGKIAKYVFIMIVGDGNGMVGLGLGKDMVPDRARSKAVADAVKNMDWVERFEKRTIWTEVETKFGATQVYMRPRPVGFGLRCNPYIHSLLTAAGIKDISAKVWGSRNPLHVLQATLRVLHAGHNPLGMGDGLGGPGRKMHKGAGLRSASEVERARGRKLIDLRK